MIIMASKKVLIDETSAVATTVVQFAGNVVNQAVLELANTLASEVADKATGMFNTANNTSGVTSYQKKLPAAIKMLLDHEAYGKLEMIEVRLDLNQERMIVRLPTRGDVGFSQAIGFFVTVDSLVAYKNWFMEQDGVEVLAMHIVWLILKSSLQMAANSVEFYTK